MRTLRLNWRSIAPKENDMATPEVIEKLDDLYIQVVRIGVIHPVLSAITRNEPLEQVLRLSRHD